MRIVLLSILVALVAQATAAELYRWTDEQGRVHYSDRPHEGAETVEVRAPSTFQSAPVSSTPAPAAPEEVARYQSVTILTPGHEDTLRNIGGQVTVGVRTLPGLRDGDRINLYLDGNRVLDGGPGRVVFQLSDVYRGTHQLSAAVEGRDGREILRSEEITFHVHQAARNRN